MVAGCNLYDNSATGQGKKTSLILRLRPDGGADPSFGDAGAVTVQDNRDVNIQPGGKLLVGLDPVVRLFP